MARALPQQNPAAKAKGGSKSNQAHLAKVTEPPPPPFLLATGKATSPASSSRRAEPEVAKSGTAATKPSELGTLFEELGVGELLEGDHGDELKQALTALERGGLANLVAAKLKAMM